MTSLESDTIPVGYDSDPSDDAVEYYQAKDGKWYTYQDRSIANRLFLEKKVEFDKLQSLVSNKDASKAPTKKKRKSPHTSTADHVRRHSGRVRETPKTVYKEAHGKGQQTKKGSSESVETSSKHTRTWDDGYRALAEFQEEESHCNVPQTYKGSKWLSNWVSAQRKLHAENRLQPEQKQKLDGLGFDWRTQAEKQEQQWMEKYNSVKDFHAKHGNFKFVMDSPLYTWTKRQRHKLSNNKLESKREKLLRDINFFPSLSEPLPGKKDADNVSNRQETEDDDDADCYIASDKEGDVMKFGATPGISKPVIRRLARNAGCRRISGLVIQPPKLSQTEESDRSWMKNYTLLQNFFERHGNFAIPDNDRLSRWVKSQRNLLNSGKLNAERAKLLCDIKCLAPRSSLEPLPEKVGSRKVSREEGAGSDDDKPDIKVWQKWASGKRAATENVEKKATAEEHSDDVAHSPNPECINYQGNRAAAELAQAEKYEQQWMDNYALLKQYHAKHGHFDVPGKSGLGGWVKRQRVTFNNNKMKDTREELLRAINFRLKTPQSPKPLSRGNGSQSLSRKSDNDDSGGDNAPSKPRRKRAATENVSYKEDGSILSILRSPSSRIRVTEKVRDEEGQESDDEDDIAQKSPNTKAGTASASQKPRQRRPTSASTNDAKSKEDEPPVPIQNEAKACGDLNKAEVGGKKLDVFGRLMPLVVKLNDTVGESRLIECSNFLQKFLQDDAKDSPGTTSPDAKSHLLHQTFQLHSALEDSPKSGEKVSCCEMYFLYLLERAEKFRARERPFKRRKVES